MPMPAARLTDMHVCPMVTGVVPHVGGPITGPGAQFYGFYDWGETWSNLPTDLNHRIASVGGGVRLGLTRNLELDGEVTHRLVTQLVPGSTSVAPLSDVVIYWGVTARY